MNISKLSSPLTRQQFSWDALVLLVVTFWLSSSVLIDFVMMPVMYESGMMNEPNFATAGYSLFWVFNRIELVCAAAVLSGLLALRQQRDGQRRDGFSVVASGAQSRWALLLSGLLLAIAFTFTYILTPQMGALGIHLGDYFASAPSEPLPQAMNTLHALYWGLEAAKLLAAGWLIKLCYRDVADAFQ